MTTRRLGDILTVVNATPGIAAILEALNPPQKEAVLHEKGPLLVLAGAGSGKTRVITHRIAYLLQKGYEPESILAITFTNKAAGEMKDRTLELCGMGSPWISTFHSFCARLLRRHVHRLDPYDNSFTIYDEEDCRSFIREILGQLKVDAKIWTPREVQEEISRIKNACKADDDSVFGSSYRYGQLFREIHALYREGLQARNAVDFDDLLLLTVRLFETQPDILQRYQDQFQQVLIDEYQDINAVQYRIGQLLASAHRNICITGDPDQSIYSWRGADITNILNFEHDYPDAKIVRLERNYRSTMNILHVANALISHNEDRLPKSLWSDNPGGEPVRVHRFLDDREEAREIATLMGELVKEGLALGDIALFYRISALSRAVEEELLFQNIPYTMVGGVGFWLRREVKDLLAYLRIIDNPRDAESLKRIANVPRRGLGNVTIEKLVKDAREKKRSLLDEVLQGGKDLRLGKRAAAAIADLASVYRQLAALKEGSLADLVTAAIQLTRYEDFLHDCYGDSSGEHISNAWELVNAASQYDKTRGEGALRGFLESVNLLGDVDRWEHHQDRVSLMTLHSAKGLEFPAVIILGVEEGILPVSHVGDSPHDTEEERRLLYVGITRAKKSLYLTHAANRMRYGKVKQAFPSRFLMELREAEGGPAENILPLEIDEETRETFLRGPGSPDGLPVVFEGESTVDWGEAGDGWDPEEDPYPVGTRVYHDEYGEGEVVRVSGVGQRRRITVAFDEGGDKQFVPGYAPLRRIR